MHDLVNQNRQFSRRCAGSSFVQVDGSGDVLVKDRDLMLVVWQRRAVSDRRQARDVARLGAAEPDKCQLFRGSKLYLRKW
jgi:hypothetical protein